MGEVISPSRQRGPISLAHVLTYMYLCTCSACLDLPFAITHEGGQALSPELPLPQGIGSHVTQLSILNLISQPEQSNCGTRSFQVKALILTFYLSFPLFVVDCRTLKTPAGHQKSTTDMGMDSNSIDLRA